jgi:hypothetical protein
VRRVAALIERHRLLTIARPGGIGKTSVALAAAETLINTYDYGAWLIELNSCSSSPRMICGCRSHNEPLRAAHRGRLTASPPGLGADHSTRSFGQAKEPWARPMRSGNPLSDHSQRAIVLALIFEPVLANEDGVRVTAPAPDQSRAGLQHDTGIQGNAGFPRGCGQLLQAALQRPARPAMGALLQLIGDGSDQQIATEA